MLSRCSLINLFFFTIVFLCLALIYCLPAHSATVTANVPDPNVESMNVHKVCFAGIVLDKLVQEDYTLYICQSKDNHSQYAYWIEGYKKLVRLSPFQLKMLLKDKVTVK